MTVHFRVKKPSLIRAVTSLLQPNFFGPLISDRVNGGTIVIFNLMFLKKRTFHFLSAMAPKDGFRIGKYGGVDFFFKEADKGADK